jgi:peptide chain release factor 1
LLTNKADSVRLYKIRKAISELSSKEGRGTELVSLYIPPKKPIHEVIAYLRNEWGTAGNIKSDTTRNHVQDALTKTMQRLKLYRDTPETGLVIFSGALPTNGPGSEVVRLNEIVPPKPVNTFLYMCVAPETKVLMGDGDQKTIGELRGSWENERVMSWDAEKRELQGSPIRDYLSVPVGGRKTYRLTVESGRSIVATEDHPFQTPRGWVRLGQLRKGDLVCVMPVADIEATGEEKRKDHLSKEVLFDEARLRELMIGEYLRIKSRIREENRQRAADAIDLRQEGQQAEASESRGSSQKMMAVVGLVQETTHMPMVGASQLPSFDEWLDIAQAGLQELLLWESVVSIEDEAIQDVRDLTVGSESHSFFANGFLVHNCDDHFHVEYLKDMLKAEKVYGILSLDSNEAGIGILSGDRLDIEDLMTSGISGKTRKGGQSARRYERGREMELTYFFNRVSEHVTRIFITDHKVSGIIVGGPGPTKENFLKGGYLDYRLQNNIIEVIDISYSGREGIREIVEKASDKLQDVRLIEERKLVQKFLGEINRPNGLAVYGLPKIIDALGRSNMDTILISDDINIVKIKMTCKNCQTVKEKVVENQKKMQTMQEMLGEPCAKCGATDYEIEESDVVDMLEEKAVEIGARVEMISSGSEEGAMLKSFGGVAGFLRYRT